MFFPRLLGKTTLGQRLYVTFLAHLGEGYVTFLAHLGEYPNAIKMPVFLWSIIHCLLYTVHLFH